MYDKLQHRAEAASNIQGVIQPGQTVFSHFLNSLARDKPA